MEAIVFALVGKILVAILAIPLVIGVFIGYAIGKAAGRMAAHRDFQDYAQMSAQQGRAVMPPEPRRALPVGRGRTAGGRSGGGRSRPQ
jgi:hypothetical protein